MLQGDKYDGNGNDYDNDNDYKDDDSGHEYWGDIRLTPSQAEILFDETEPDSISTKEFKSKLWPKGANGVDVIVPYTIAKQNGKAYNENERLILAKAHLFNFFRRHV